MLDLVNEFFDTRNDPEQISVDETERDLLAAIHPSTLSELANEDGPIVWILVVPTSTGTMNRFLAGLISEKQLLLETKPGTKYEAIYLCSASVLPEFRNKGLAKKVTIDAVNAIRIDNPVKALYYWPFSEEGKLLAVSTARDLDLPLSIPFKDIPVPKGSAFVVESGVTISGTLFIVALFGLHEILLPGTILKSANGIQWAINNYETFERNPFQKKLIEKGISFYSLKGVGHQKKPKVGESLTVLKNE